MPDDKILRFSFIGLIAVCFISLFITFINYATSANRMLSSDSSRLESFSSGNNEPELHALATSENVAVSKHIPIEQESETPENSEEQNTFNPGEETEVNQEPVFTEENAVPPILKHLQTCIIVYIADLNSFPPISNLEDSRQFFESHCNISSASIDESIRTITVTSQDIDSKLEVELITDEKYEISIQGISRL